MFPHSSSPIFIYTNTPHTVTFTLSLHDALPIWPGRERGEEAVELGEGHAAGRGAVGGEEGAEDRKSTRLNSSHPSISYAVFCLKKKNDGSDVSGKELSSSYNTSEGQCGAAMIVS